MRRNLTRLVEYNIYLFMKGGSTLNNNYICRKHLREPVKFFIVMGLMIFLPYFPVSSILILTNLHMHNKLAMALFVLIAGSLEVSVITIAYLSLYFKVYKGYQYVHLILAEQGIIYSNARGEIRIPYESIRALEFASIKYRGKCIKIIHNYGNIKLTVAYENIGDMIKNLKNKLDEKNMSFVYNKETIYRFFKIAKYKDQSWERRYENLKFFASIILVTFGAEYISLAFIAEASVKILVIIGALAGFILACIISKIAFKRKLENEAVEENFSVPERDKKFEAKIYKWVFGIYTILFLMIPLMLIVKGM